ncbi:MAG: segregation/condensation protein A [Oscillospiraceae bacterium]|nr:segregation/condensation protein A [Oscillospiraceae bacterium]
MENPNYHLQGIVREKDSLQDFEGPLSLILMLLQKNKIEIRDLKVSDILDQYLDYLVRMQEMDLDIASEFVQMASHLLYLKTRELLTTEEEVSELEMLMESLEQLQAKERFHALTEVIPEMKKASETGLLFFSKLPEPLKQPNADYPYRHEPVDLLKAMLALWTRGDRSRPEMEAQVFAAVPPRITYSIREKGREILSRIRSGPVLMTDVYAQCRSASELVATFVAILELCRSGNLQLNRENDRISMQYVGDEQEIEAILESFEEEQ